MGLIISGVKRMVLNSSGLSGGDVGGGEGGEGGDIEDGEGGGVGEGLL